MGYHRKFIPTQESINEYNEKYPQPKNTFMDFSLHEYKTVILENCLNYQNNDRKVFCGYSTELTYFYRILKTELEKIQKQIHINTFQRLKNEYNKEGCFWVDGWNYEPHKREQCDIDLIYESTLQELCIISSCFKADIFDNEDRFYNKMEKIQDSLYAFEESISEWCIWQIMEDFAEFECKNADDDDDDDDDDEAYENDFYGANYEEDEAKSQSNLDES